MPVQPGDKHYTVLEDKGDSVTVKTDGIASEEIYISQSTVFADNIFTGIVQVHTSRDGGRAKHSFDYDTCKARRCEEWEARRAVADKKLYEEDSTYTGRVPLDLKRAKPTDKRIIDSTLPYEALPLYQVTKQADVVCLMNNLPLHFTNEEKRAKNKF